jgi:hypothetical protein
VLVSIPVPEVVQVRVIDRVAPGGCPPGAPTDPDVHL